jgi:hypothetical protein
MFVYAVIGLAAMGGAVYSALDRTSAPRDHPDRRTAALLLISAVLLVTALLVALVHLARG